MKKLGSAGEELAAVYLQQQGYQILERNWRIARGEIDLIAMQDEQLVFIEVKTRNTFNMGTPQEAVSHAKKEKLRSLAIAYIYQSGRTAASYRFDVVAVDARSGRIDLVQDAF